MAQYKIRGTNKTVKLTDKEFRAKGGEGSIYIVGDDVFKVCEPGKMIPEKKFLELSALDHPRIVRPQEILLDSKDRVVGYTMKLVPGNAVPLAQVLSRTFRDREGLTPEKMRELVKQISEGLRFIHKRPGYLQVDGNEFNYMVTSDFGEIYFIDVNSYQTPNFPADAIMPSIRDYSCPQDPNTGLYQWSQLTDWYSFAIISFYMFTAIHPFKGFHPKFTDRKTAMFDQMKASKSVLDPEVDYPKAAVYAPFEDVIPGGASGAYMQWYRAIFIDNKRIAAPADYQAAIAAVVAVVKEIVGSNNFDIVELRKYVTEIVGYYSKNGRDVIVTKDKIYVNNQPDVRPAERFRVGFTDNHVAVAAWLEGEQLRIKDLDSKVLASCELRGKELMSCEGRLYLLCDQHVLEIDFLDLGGTKLMALGNSVASVLPNASQMFQGVVLQDMFGSCIASIFPQKGHHRQIPIKEFSKIKITEAKYEGNVLMAIGLDEETGQYSRYVLRFSKSWDSYDLRVIDNINPIGLNFTVLENGICVCITEEERLEIFSSQKDAASLKSFADPAIKANMRLCHMGTEVRFAHGEKLYKISVKK